MISGVPAAALGFHNPTGKLDRGFGGGVAVSASRSEFNGISNHFLLSGDSRFRWFMVLLQHCLAVPVSPLLCLVPSQLWNYRTLKREIQKPRY